MCWFGSILSVFAAPDIAIFLTDQQRADALGLVDPTFHTPAMDQLARDGVRFTRAFCATPQCSPARAALLTGKYPHRVGVMGNVGTNPIPAGMSPALDPAIPSLGKIFAAAGYETAYFGKWHLGRTPRDHGFQTSGAERNDEEATRQAVAFLNQHRAAAAPPRPLLLVISWVNPHDIYEVNRVNARDSSEPQARSRDIQNGRAARRSLPPHPDPLPQGEGIRQPARRDTESARLVQQRRSDLPLPKREGRGEGEGSAATPAADSLPRLPLPKSLNDDLATKPFPQRHYLEADQGRAVQNYQPEDWRRYLALYRHLTAKVDSQIGEVVAALRQSNPNALIVLSSDHGDLGGAHGLPFKGPAMYEELVRVPLLISQPGKIAPRVSEALVTHLDLLPTLCELAGIATPADTDGQSLAPLLTGKKTGLHGRDAIFAEYYGKQNWRVPIRMVRSEDWKYVRYANYGEELYHMKSDRAEIHNRASATAHRRAKNRLAARLDRWIIDTADPFPTLTVTERSGRPLEVPNQAQSRSEKGPNVVMIVGDDQGWGDFGFMGHPHIQTPHLDKLASESAVFPNGYVPTSLCRASLATLLTGLYASQHKICCNDPPNGVARDAMHPFMRNAQAIPRLLQARGYRSLQTGKFWEGHYSNAGFTHGMTEKGRHGDAGLIIGRQTMQPIYDFIDSCGEEPFFVWYAPMMPHEPHNPPERLLQKYAVADRHSKVAKYWAMCEWFDETCGALLDYLERKKLRDNTLLIFVVDNGWIQETNPVQTTRGWFAPKSKLSPYDGGVRTPILLRWPGHTKPGRHNDLVSTIDLAPTILSACGIEPNKAMPGLSLLEVAAGKVKLKRNAVFGEIYLHTSVNLDQPALNLTHRWIREGDWKLIIDPAGDRLPELYNLEKDPTEMVNLANREPGGVKRLSRALQNAFKNGRQLSNRDN
ncbi:MAG: sulfatase-like hydrolase/transferase [Verrucomicrobia bacterium]|nr:sulfatase-like hydrolase/transferase [Verrucomicrobiota bacterium]